MDLGLDLGRHHLADRTLALGASEKLGRRATHWGELCWSRGVELYHKLPKPFFEFRASKRMRSFKSHVNPSL